MPVLDKIAVPNADEVKNEVLSLVIGTLGLSKAAFFCRQYLTRPTDYLEFKEEAFTNESVVDLAARITAERTAAPSQ